MLRSLPPRVPCVTTNIPNVPANVTPASDNIVGPLVITDTTPVVGCTALVNQPTGQTGTPQPPTMTGLRFISEPPSVNTRDTST